MCRLMAVRAREPVPLYRCLISGDNSFALQSLEHPDGWGVAYYDGEHTVLSKSILPAICDELFEELSFGVRANTIIGHIRLATAGQIEKRNCHPFRFGEWIFAHNGHIQEFPEIRDELMQLVLPELREGIESDTDSEVFFRLFLSRYSEGASITAPAVPDQMVAAVTAAIAQIREVSEPLARSKGNENPCWLSCLMFNGSTMMAVSCGKPMAMRVIGAEEGERRVFISSEEIATRGLLDEVTGWRDIRFGEAVLIDEALRVEHRELGPAVEPLEHNS